MSPRRLPLAAALAAAALLAGGAHGSTPSSRVITDAAGDANGASALTTSAPLETKVWQLTRTDPGPTDLVIDMQAAFEESETVFAGAFLRHGQDQPDPGPQPPAQDTAQPQAPPGPVPGSFAISDQGTAGPTAHAGGWELSCSAVPGCTTQPARGLALTRVFRSDAGLGDPDAPDTILLVGTGRGVQASLASGQGQWTLKQVQRQVRFAWARQGQDNTGVHTQAAGAGVLQRSSLTGGPHGSVAVGAPPCTPFILSPVGIGQATLTGGARPATVTCPTSFDPALAVAAGPTRWDFRGTVVGATRTLPSGSGIVSLVVIDTPDPDKAEAKEAGAL